MTPTKGEENKPGNRSAPIWSMSELKTLIMPAEDPRLLDINFPYTYEVSNPFGAAYYFGTRHITQRNDRMFKLIIDSFERFRPDYVLVELEPRVNTMVPVQERADYRDTYLNTSRETAVENGEVYLGIKLAADYRIPVECPEPSYSEVYKHLGEIGFKPIEIASYYLLRAASNYPAYQSKWSMEQLMEYRIGQLKPYWPHDPGFLTWQSAKTFAKATFGETFSLEPEILKLKVPPTVPPDSPHRSILSDLARGISDLLEAKVVNRILELVFEGKRVYTLFGASHAVRHEHALFELIRGRQAIN